MMFAFYHLLSNPATLVRLQEELLEAMPNANAIPPTKTLEELPWLVRYVSIRDLV